MNIVIEEIVSDFPVLITEEVVQINISDANSYFDLIEVSDISFEGKNNYVPTVNESTNKIELKPVQGSGFSGSYNDLTDIPNDLVLDADYIHTDNNFTNALKQKLDDTPTSFAPVNATQNSPDSTLLNRSNHTGTQLASTISDFANAVGLIIVSALTGYATENWVISQGFITNVISALGFTPENSANKGTVIGNETSATIYPHAKGVVDYIASLGYQTAAMVSSLITSALASFKTSEFLDATSSIQGQLDSKTTPFYAILTPTTETGGTSSEYIHAQFTIPADSFGTAFFISMKFAAKKTTGGTTAQFRHYIKWSTTDYASATQLAFYLTPLSTHTSTFMESTFNVESGKLRTNRSSTVSLAGESSTTTLPEEFVFNPAIDNTFYIVLQRNGSSSTDTFGLNSLDVRITKKP